MIVFERKNINNRPFFYLTEQVRVGKKYKKIQVFVGKNIPKDPGSVFDALKKKEKALLKEQFSHKQFKTTYLQDDVLKSVEQFRIDWKYHKTQLTNAKHEKMLRDFAIRFIFESNAIEGSKLSKEEVSAIIKKQYIKKNTPRKEIWEVLNSIRAFEYIQTPEFKLTQKGIKTLHAIITKDLDVAQGFKKVKISVNNKETVAPEKVREELTKLISWYNKTKKTEHPFVRAIIFHNRFEHVHPFEDGNGRTGRLILNWMLMQEGYGVILFKNSNRTAYMSALDKGDDGRYRNILNFSTKAYRKTIQDLIG